MRVDGGTRRHCFRVMGTEAEILWAGGTPDLGRAGEDRLRDLERAWSRFLETSEVSMLNGAPPHSSYIVSPETYTLFEVAVRAWEVTAGRFDPTLLDALVAAGYDRTFEEVPRRQAAATPAASRPRRCDPGISLDPVVRTVSLGSDVGFDPGGIGKGLAADLVTAHLLAQGACEVLVNVGGDIRVRHTRGCDGLWTVTIANPFDPDGEIGRITLADGGVATSSRLGRAWHVGDVRMHHLIDPRTGRPLSGDIVAVSVVASAAWWAEALTKAVFVAGLRDGVGLLEELEVTAIAVDVDGGVHTTGAAGTVFEEMVTA